MKKIIYALLAFTLVFGASNKTAQANSQLVTFGQFVLGTQIGENYSNYGKDAVQSLDPSLVLQRMQFGFRWIADEKISAMVIVRAPGEMAWGNQQDLFSITTGGSSKSFDEGTYFAVKVANILWTPSDQFKAMIGRQFYRTPNYLGLAGSPVFGEYTDGIRLFGNITSELSYDFYWGRNHLATIASSVLENYSYEELYKSVFISQDWNTGYFWDENQSEMFSSSPLSHDYFFTSLAYKTPLVELCPWGGLAVVGKDVALRGSQPYNADFYNLTGETAYIVWAGLTTKMKLDTLTFGLDGGYSKPFVDYRGIGYVVDAYARNQFSNFSLGVVAWYANGNKEDEIAGLISNAFDGFWPVMHSGYFGAGLQPSIVGSGPATPIGTTGASLEFMNYKPIKYPLTIGANATFIKGTNHENFTEDSGYEYTSGNGLPYYLSGNLAGFGNYLTTKDHVIDLGVNAKYMASEKLFLGVEYNYLMPHLGREGAVETTNGFRLGLVAMFNI